jgi:hypothetical protein
MGSSLSDLEVIFARGDSVPSLPLMMFNNLGQPQLSETGDAIFWAEFVNIDTVLLQAPPFFVEIMTKDLE